MSVGHGDQVGGHDPGAPGERTVEVSQQFWERDCDDGRVERGERSAQSHGCDHHTLGERTSPDARPQAATRHEADTGKRSTIEKRDETVEVASLTLVLGEYTDDTLVTVHFDGLTVLYSCRRHACTYHGGDAILAGDYGAVAQDAAGVGNHSGGGSK
jgi:hypothetical protein